MKEDKNFKTLLEIEKNKLSKQTSEKTMVVAVFLWEMRLSLVQRWFQLCL